MPSPDFSEYVDLTINDVQPGDIYSQAVEYARAALPEFSPRNGTVEDAMLQAMAYMSGVVTGAINRLPNGLMEGLLRLMGFERSEETFASISVRFTAIDDTGVTIPAGTQVSFREVTDVETIEHIFETTVASQIPVGQTQSGVIPVVAIDAGEKPIISDGDVATILSASNKLFSCVFAGNIVQGAAGESDQDYFTRAVTYIQSLNTALATTSQIAAFTLTGFNDAERVTAYDLTNVRSLSGVRVFESSGLIGASLSQDPTVISPTPAPGDLIRVYGATPEYYNGLFTVDSVGASPDRVIYFANTVGASTGETIDTSFELDLLEDANVVRDEDLGYVTLFVAKNDGSGLSREQRIAIKDSVEAKSIAGLQVFVRNALILPVYVNVSIFVNDGFSSLEIRELMDQRVTSMLSPAMWDWSPIIRRTQLITNACSCVGVGYLDSLEITLDAGEELAYIDGDGNVVFNYAGVLPQAVVTVGTVN